MTTSLEAPQAEIDIATLQTNVARIAVMVDGYLDDAVTETDDGRRQLAVANRARFAEICLQLFTDASRVGRDMKQLQSCLLEHVLTDQNLADTRDGRDPCALIAAIATNRGFEKVADLLPYIHTQRPEHGPKALDALAIVNGRWSYNLLREEGIAKEAAAARMAMAAVTADLPVINHRIIESKLIACECEACKPKKKEGFVE